jgi:hypothetical protein
LDTINIIMTVVHIKPADEHADGCVRGDFQAVLRHDSRVSAAF